MVRTIREHTDSKTDRETDRRTVRVILILPHQLWYNKQTYMYQTKYLVRYKEHCFKAYSII